MQLYDLPTWAALGSRLHQIAVPASVRRVHVFADNGGPGLKAANLAVETFTRQGRRVALRFPPRQFKDWNDALVALGREQAEGTAA
jgi:hypothetical protein